MLGPEGWSMPVCEMDVRAGGRYRWSWRRDADGKAFGFTGTFREVQPPSKIAHTEAYVAGNVGGSYPSHEAIMTLSFAEDGGVTTLTTVIDFGSKDARDAAVSAGMTGGMEQSYQRLDRLLDEWLQATR